MKRRISILDRLVTLAAGTALLSGAAVTLAWVTGAQWARELVRRLDRGRIAAAPDASWWPTVLAAVAVLTFLAGLALLVVNLRRGRTPTMPVLPGAIDPGGGTGAGLSVDLSPLAIGLAAELAALSGVRTVRSTTLDDRGLATLRVTVIAESGIDVADFTRNAEAMARSMAAALPGAPVATQVLLHLDPADQSGTSKA